LSLQTNKSKVMMNWKNVLVIGAFSILPVSMMAQANILNAKSPEEIGKKTEAQKAADNDAPLAYGYVDDRDILWSKTTDRRSLYHILMKNIRNGKITDVYTDSYFSEKRSLKDLSATLQKVDTTDLGYEQINAGENIVYRLLLLLLQMLTL